MHPKSFATTTCNHMHVPVATPRAKALLKFLTFDSDPDRALQILTASMGPMGLRHVWPFVLAPSGRSWQTHACMGLLPACVGTVPCTWLHTARLFWCVNTFWPPLGHFPVTTGILAVFCRLWAAANWAMVGARPCKVAQSLL